MSSEGKYGPLHNWLSSQPQTSQTLPLTFERIEAIINEALPESARKHQAWWANDTTSHSYAQAWLDAGWKAEEVNISTGNVTFRRV